MKNIVRNLRDKDLILAAIILYFITYGIVFNSLILNNDSIMRVIGVEETRLSSGRFITDAYNHFVHNGISAPLISFVIAGIALIAGAYFIIKVIKFKKNYQKLCIYGLVITYPIIAFFTAYGSDFDLYCIAFFTGVLSIYFLFIDKKVVASLACIIITLGIYQAFLVIITGLFFLNYLVEYFEKQELNLLDILKNLLIICIGLVLYEVVLNIFLLALNVDMTSYRGADSLSIIQIFQDLPINILKSFYYFLKIVICDSLLFNTDFDHLFINIAFILVVSIRSILILFKKSKVKDKMIFVLMLFLFIPSLYSVNFIVLGFYDYIMFGYLVFTIFVVYLIDFKKEYIKYFYIILIGLYMFFNVSKINQYHLQTKILTETALSESLEIANDLYRQKGYTSDSKVLIEGNLKNNNSIAMYNQKPFDIRNKFLGKTLPGFRNGLRVSQLIEDQGLEINYDPNIIYNKERFDSAPEFPKEGYIYEENGNFIIKLADTNK